MELIKTAIRNLLRRRGRTALTVSGIAVGMLMVSLVSVIGSAGESLATNELNSMGVGGLSVTTDDGSILLNEEALEEIRALPQVSSAMPLMVYYGNASTAKGTQSTVLCGIDAGAGQVISLELMHGRMLSHSDVETAASVCVLDEAMAKAAYGRNNVVGKTVTVQVGSLSETLTVIGVTKTGSSLLQNMAAMIPGMVYIPYTTQKNLTGQTGFDQFAVRANGEATESTQSAIKRVLNRLYQGSASFRTDDLAAQKDRLLRLVELIALVLTVLSAVSLVVSGFGIVTAMLSAVNERKREIGVKKAVGASQKRILAEFLVEAGLLSAAGALVGMLPAAALAIILPLSGVSVSVSPWLFLKLIGFSVAVGVVFGVYPAYKASKLQPVEALRSE